MVVGEGGGEAEIFGAVAGRGYRIGGGRRVGEIGRRRRPDDVSLVEFERIGIGRWLLEDP